MSVIRIKKARTPYVTLNTTALNDEQLSFRACGLHTYLMSKPDNWEVLIIQLEKRSPREGRDAIRTALQELIDAGYLKRERKQNKQTGRMAGWESTVYETPELAAQSESTPTTDNGLAEVGSTNVGSTDIGLAEVGSTNVGQSDANYSCIYSNLNLSNPPIVPPGGDGLCVMPPEVENLLAEVKTESKAIRSGVRPEAVYAPDDILHRSPTTKAAKAAKKKLPTDYAPGFLAWWEAYPHDRRVSKPMCYRAWCNLGLELRWEEQVEKLERLKITTWKDCERKHVKTSLPYLNEGRSEDELVPLEMASASPRPFTRAEQRRQHEEQTTRELEDLVLGRDTHNSVWATPRRDGKDVQQTTRGRRQGGLLDGPG